MPWTDGMTPMQAAYTLEAALVRARHKAAQRCYQDVVEDFGENAAEDWVGEVEVGLNDSVLEAMDLVAELGCTEKEAEEILADLFMDRVARKYE